MVENIAALTIAGSDPGGNAGIQADLKTFSALSVYGTTVITAVTVQDLRGVTAIQPVEPGIVEKQLLAVLRGFPVKAIKTGMLFSKEIVEKIAVVLSQFEELPLVIDPVLTASSGKELLQKDALEILMTNLFPLAEVITPNLTEAAILAGLKAAPAARGDMESAAQNFYEKFKIPVLLKGGHLPATACDVLCYHKGSEVFQTGLIKDVNNHGSGCTLSAAITAFLAKGLNLKEAVREAKEYITGSLKNPFKLDKDTRIINHFYKS